MMNNSQLILCNTPDNMLNILCSFDILLNKKSLYIRLKDFGDNTIMKFNEKTGVGAYNVYINCIYANNLTENLFTYIL